MLLYSRLNLEINIRVIFQTARKIVLNILAIKKRKVFEVLDMFSPT